MTNLNRLVVEKLLAMEAHPVPAFALFERLTGDEGVSNEALIALEPEIEAALIELEDIATNSRKAVGRCSELQPVPDTTVPAGF